MPSGLAKQRIKNVFKDVSENLRHGKRANVSNTMLKHGYPQTSASALSITKTKTWQELLNEIEDEPLVKHQVKIALSEDKRAATGAFKELMSLKDKYPAGKLKIQEYNDEVNKLKE